MLLLTRSTAKFSRALIRRIYQHVLEEGWIAAGDTVLDPFGGVGLGGRDALQAGLHWVGVELEPRFVELGNQNIALWQALAERAAAWGLNGWGTATLLQGDSRQLTAVLGGAGAGLGVSSPPYVSGGHHDGTFTTWGGDANKQGGCAKWATKDGGYGSDPANLGNMREGSHALALADLKEREILNTGGFVYLFFPDPDNGKTLFLEVFISSSILQFLSSAGVPVFTVNLNDEIPIRQIEVTQKPGNFELLNVRDMGSIEHSGESSFKLALSAFPVTTNRTIDATTILQAMGLYGKYTPAGRAFTLHLNGSKGSETSLRTEPGPVLESGFQDAEFLSALLANDSNTGSMSTKNATFPRTKAFPSFCIASRDNEGLTTCLTNQFNRATSENVGTFSRTTLIKATLDLALSYIEFLSTDNTNAIGFCSIEKSTAGSRAEMILRTTKIPIRLSDECSALVTGDSVHHHTSNNRVPLSIMCNKSNVKSGQLGAMAVSSPPYADGAQHTGGPTRNTTGQGGPIQFVEYGTSPGQLGAMAVSSPPWEASLDRGTVNKDERVKLARKLGIANAEHISPIDMEKIGKREQEYGDAAGQIGNDTGANFWLAARAVVEQLRLCLRPGAHAVFVTKRFVRDKKIVDFSQQWADLCAACGFELVHWHRAWLVEDRGSQIDLFGEMREKKIKRASFFRRLYEKKFPENAIEWEDVLCFVLK